MNARGHLRLILRDLRGSRARLTFFVACLSVGVAAVVAVAGLSASLEEGIRSQARELHGADLVVQGSRPLPPELDAALERWGALERTDLREMPTLVSALGEGDAPGPSQLVELKAVDGRYPFYGELALDPPRPLAELLDPEGAVASPDLLQRLRIEVGDTLKIGGARFVLRGIALSEPDRQTFSLTLGPRLFLSGEGLARADLERFGSLIRYRALVRMSADMPVESVREMARDLAESLPDKHFLRVRTYVDAQRGLRRSIERVESYLGLVALLSLLVGGIGIAQTVRAWIASRAEPIAILQALGARPREVLGQFVAQTILLAGLGSAVGVVLGVLVQAAVPSLAGELLPAALIRPWQPATLLRGLLLGIGVALVFALPALLGILRVPPSLVLRRDATLARSGRVARGVAFALVLTGVLVTAWFQSGSLERGALFAGGVTLAAALLSLAARAVIWLVRRVPRERLGLVPRHGIAALARPEAGTVSGVLALGLGTLLVLALFLVQRALAAELSTNVPKDAPNAFLIDVQPDQWPGVERLLLDHGATEVDSTPVVVARLASIDGTPVEQLVEERRHGRGSRWVLTREQRLTYAAELPAGNVLVEGSLWSEPERAEVSLEEDFANDLEVGPGSELVFDVQGVPIAVLVTSVRTVEWRTFGINFFVVVEPGVLESAPQSRLAAARLAPQEEGPLQDELVARYPNVTMLRVREILEKLVSVLEQIGLGVRLLGGFTVVAGVAILAGAIGASAARRAREVALLKALGATRTEIAAMHATEHALVGLVAGTIGAAGGALLARAVLTQGLEIESPLPLAPVLAAVFLAALLGVLAGLATSLRALRARPAEVLRAE